MVKDAADRHVERWRDHWVLEEEFDDDVEAMSTRLAQLNRHFKATTKAALATAGLQDFEYDTLHALMIRDVPGLASPGALAKEMGVSNAGVTGRLDTLEEKGWVKRVPGTGDRRRVDVEVTRAGVRIWREAMHLRGAEEDAVATALTRTELRTLNRLLKKLTLHAERRSEGS